MHSAKCIQRAYKKKEEVKWDKHVRRKKKEKGRQGGGRINQGQTKVEGKIRFLNLFGQRKIRNKKEARLWTEMAIGRKKVAGMLKQGEGQEREKK